MANLPNDHRGHSIFTHASGPVGGMWVASYSAWPVAASSSSGAFCEGTAPGLHQTQDRAHWVAAVEARRNLDALLARSCETRA